MASRTATLAHRGDQRPRSRVAVIIATVGRPLETQSLLDRLERQSVAPSHVILSVGSPADLPQRIPDGAITRQGPKGLPAQRNRGLDALPPGSCDVVVFYDDDFVPALNSLELLERVFTENADVVGVTGRVIADGIKTPGIDETEAYRLVDADRDAAARAAKVDGDVMGLSGCNMAFRASAIGDLRFDEKLPLYAWQEDTDFSRRLLPQGRLVRSDAIAGVHRGVKGARNSGLRFGWSQVVNPLYLVRKGSLPPLVAARMMVKNIVANHLMMLRPEPWIDRRGRVKGNWKAMAYVLGGNLDPREMLKLP